MQIGLVGYFFQELTPDTGPGAKLGAFEGRTGGVGPQVGFIFPVSDSYQGYINLKAYKDLAVENRPDGWTAWVTFALTPKAPEPPPAAAPLTRIY